MAGPTTLISAFLAGEENGQKIVPAKAQKPFLLALTSKSSARMMEMFLLLDKFQTFCGPKSVGASQHPDEVVFNFGPQNLLMPAIPEALLDHIQMHLDQLLCRDYVGIYTTVIEEKNTNMVSAADDSGIPSLDAPVPPRGNDGQRPIEQSPALFAGGNGSLTAAATGKHRHGASTTRHAFNS